MDYAYSLLDRGYVPDTLLRTAIRRLCRVRQREIDYGKSLFYLYLIFSCADLLSRIGSLAASHAAKLAFIADLYNRPIAIEQDKANEQHYEVPTAFLQLCLGPRMKYSSCLWESPKSGLSDAEDAILSSYCVDARLGKGLRGVGAGSQPQGTSDIRGEKVTVQEWEAGNEGEGLRILDLGCGWGSLGLFLAEVS